MGKNDKIESLIKKGFDLVDAKKFSKALELFDSALNLNPNHPDGLRGRALCLRKLYKYSESQTTLDDTLKKNPNDNKLVIEQANYIWLKRNTAKRLIF